MADAARRTTLENDLIFAGTVRNHRPSTRRAAGAIRGKPSRRIRVIMDSPATSAHGRPHSHQTWDWFETRATARQDLT